MTHDESEENSTFANSNDASHILEDQLCVWAQGCWPRTLGFFLSDKKNPTVGS